MPPRPELRPKRMPAELNAKWTAMELGIAILTSAVGVVAVAEHLKGNERKELGSYFKGFKDLLRQRKRMVDDPANVLSELPENRTITRIIALAAHTIGVPIHNIADRIPEKIPDFVADIRTYKFRGSPLHFEEIDVYVNDPSRIRTISTLAGGLWTLILYNSPEKDRALRILSELELGRKLMEASGLKYPPDDPK